MAFPFLLVALVPPLFGPVAVLRFDLVSPAAGFGAHGLEAGFVEHPLNGAVEEDGVVEVGNLAVEPEVDAGDGGGFEVAELLADGGGLGGVGKDAF